jgi:hypothetical protein
MWNLPVTNFTQYSVPQHSSHYDDVDLTEPMRPSRTISMSDMLAIIAAFCGAVTICTVLVKLWF